jgi:hypothetical protein
MSAGDQMGDAFHAHHPHHDEIVEDALAQAAEPQEHADDVPPDGAGPLPRPRLVRSFSNRRHPKGVPRLLKRAADNLPSRSSRHATTPHRPADADGRRTSPAGGKVEPVRSSMDPVFRTEVAVCDLTVTGVLRSTAPLQEGVIAVGGDVHRLSCDQALELVDALLLVVTRMDVVVEERHSATIATTRDRGD